VVIQSHFDFTRKLSLLLAVLLGLLLSFSNTTTPSNYLMHSPFDPRSWTVLYYLWFFKTIIKLCHSSQLTRCFFLFVSQHTSSTTGTNKCKRMHPWDSNQDGHITLYHLYYVALIVHPTVELVPQVNTHLSSGLGPILLWQSRAQVCRTTNTVRAKLPPSRVKHGCQQSASAEDDK